MKKINYIISILFMMIMGSLLVTFSRQNKKTSAEYSDLQNQYNELASDTDALKESYTELEESYINLEEYKETLENDKETLENEVDTLKQDIEDKELEIDELNNALEAKKEKQKQAQIQAPKPTVHYEQSTEPGVLTASKGVNYNANGNKETYYNLNMSGVVNNAKNMGIEGDYWVRDDGVKMYGDKVIVAANLDTYPRGSTVETSLGEGIVLDTGGFAESNPEQFDIAVDW